MAMELKGHLYVTLKASNGDIRWRHPDDSRFPTWMWENDGKQSSITSSMWWFFFSCVNVPELFSASFDQTPLSERPFYGLQQTQRTLCCSDLSDGKIHDSMISWYIPGWWLTYPSEKYKSQLGWLFPIDGKTYSKPPTSDIFTSSLLLLTSPCMAGTDWCSLQHSAHLKIHVLKPIREVEWVSKTRLSSQSVEIISVLDSGHFSGFPKYVCSDQKMVITMVLDAMLI